MDFALTATRLRPRFGIDDAIGGALTILALLLTALIGINDSERPIYGPIDEVTHTAYVLAVAKDGIPPFFGRDRAFASSIPIAARDVRIPIPEVGSAGIPFGPSQDIQQSEAIQPPFYYYAAAPVTWFVSGRATVVALRLFDTFLCLCAIALVFLSVRDISRSPLGGGIAALLVASAGGMIDIFSYVTNGAMMLALGAGALWLSVRGMRDRYLGWPLVIVAAALSVTHTVVIPLAAICVLAPAVRQLRTAHRPWPMLLGRLAIGALPLVLWIGSSLYRYHWFVPRSVTVSGLTGATTGPLDLPQFATTFYGAFIGSFQEAFHWFAASPYVYDWRPLMVFIPIIIIGLACALMRGSLSERQALGFWLLAFITAEITVFCALYAAVILTGGGDFVYRYFSAAQAAAACVAGTCFAMLFRNQILERAAAIVIGLALAYWTYNASPL